LTQAGCAGQIELYTHLPVFRQLINTVLRKWDYFCCCVNIIDSQVHPSPTPPPSLSCRAPARPHTAGARI
jgi:hypothetical protein